MKSYSVRKRIAKQKADAIFSKYIRARDGNKCVLCGSEYMVQCGHLIKRGKHAVRYDLLNCHAQCSRCNMLHNYEPDHYINWFIRKFSADMYTDLYEKSLERCSRGLKEYEELIQKYKQKYKEVQELEKPNICIEDLPF